MATKKEKNKGVVIYQAKSGAIELRGDFSHETIWATLDQIADVFGRDKSVISRHFKGIFNEGELQRNSVVAKNATTAIDGKTYQVEYYNLDAIISVGYRVNSAMATQFRIWATKALRSYIVDGFAINKNRIKKNYDQFLGVVEDIKKLLPRETVIDTGDAISLITLFADTWLSLDAYDRDALPKGKLTKKKVTLTAEKVTTSLTALRGELVREKKATDIFGQERNAGAVAGIVGNVMQTFGGKELYVTVEEKAAYLLYFMVKNHPFVDGNKRSGAFAFVWFLRQANILDVKRLTPSALTVLTILVASSDPKDREKVVGLVLNLIAKK